jgi:hypothetical protein
MAGVTRIYVYRFTPPSDPLTLATAIHAAAQVLVKHNKHVEKVDTAREGEDMLLRVTVKGHDQWWIKKHVVYPVAGLMAKVGIKVKTLTLVAVERPPDSRSTRPRASDGRSRPLHPDEMIPHEGIEV